MHLFSSLASCLPDLINRPVIVYCHSACEHQYGLIQVYDLKMRRAAVGFITQLHERRIIWDSLIKQLSEQKEKKMALARNNPICRQQPAPIQKRHL